jgi:hypothetical protein
VGLEQLEGALPQARRVLVRQPPRRLEAAVLGISRRHGRRK